MYLSDKGYRQEIPIAESKHVRHVSRFPWESKTGRKDVMTHRVPER